MTKILMMIALLALVVPVATTQSEDNRTIAFLRYGPLRAFDVTESAVLDVLAAYGHLSPLEHELLQSRQDLQGENLNIIWGDANFDLPTANLMLENALDQDPDVLITLTTTVTQLAINATSDLDDPPVVIFSSVFDAYDAGLMQSPCIKPANVAGAISSTPYNEILDLLQTQYPEIETIGTIFSSSEATGAAGVEEITEISELRGLSVMASAITGISELNVAAEALISKGVEAFVMPIDLVIGESGTPILVQISNEYDIPVFHPTLLAIEQGATVSAGFYSYAAQGENLGRLLAGHLDGAIDVTETAIIEQSSTAIGVNLDEAERKGITIAQAILDQAEIVIADGEATISIRVNAGLESGQVMSLEDRQERDELFFAFLNNRVCSEERIAREQAQLDAEEG